MVRLRNLRERLSVPGWVSTSLGGVWEVLENWHTTEFAIEKIHGSHVIPESLLIFGLVWLAVIIFLPPPPRRLRGKRRRSLETTLAPYAHAPKISVGVFALPGVDDTSLLGIDIRDALTKAGIQSQLHSASLMGDEQYMARGIWVTGRDSNEQIHEPLESLLIRGLNEAGFDARHAMPQNEHVAVVIGARD